MIIFDRCQKKTTKGKPIKLNMTFEEAMKKALSTPLKDSKVNQNKKKAKKAKK